MMVLLLVLIVISNLLQKRGGGKTCFKDCFTTIHKINWMMSEFHYKERTCRLKKSHWNLRTGSKLNNSWGKTIQLTKNIVFAFYFKIALAESNTNLMSKEILNISFKGWRVVFLDYSTFDYPVNRVFYWKLPE